MKITVADYLAKRLSMIGIENVFGLPGDYNFNILDAIIKNEDINWINSTNELNAGYSADGYARFKGFGAIVTTYGVGELSAINAIAGAYAENVPVMKIVGVPATSMIENNILVHHNLRNTDYYAFERAYSNVVETTAYLNKYNPKEEIDRVFEAMIKTRNPVYLSIPVDICLMEIEDNIPEVNMISNVENLNQAVNKMANIINNSKMPVILADFIVKRFNVKNILQEIIDYTNILSTSLIMGKGTIDEHSESFIGTDMGALGSEKLQNIMKNSDCIISIGALISDLNSGGFSVELGENTRIIINSNNVLIDGESYCDIWINDVLAGLLEVLNRKKTTEIVDFGYNVLKKDEQPLKMEDIFPLIQEFLEEKDIFFVETGTVATSSGLMRLPNQCEFHTQTLWGSIGWATPALFGAAIADRTRRGILLTGEGAHQLTVQEMANVFEFDINPVIFVLNNSGYTIERILSNNPMDKFNDITSWNYTKIPTVFNKDAYCATVKTNKELEKILETIKVEQKNKTCYIELITEKMDVPEVAYNMIESIRKNIKTKVIEKV